MNGWQRHFRAGADATRADPSAVDRVCARATWPRRLLRAATPALGPVPAAHLVLAPRRRPIRLVALAAAAVALLLAPPVPDISGRVDGLVTRDLGAATRIRVDGDGEIHGTADAPWIRWEAGTLDVDVTPGRNVALVVETDEGAAFVVGTRFRVTRDAFGTTVAVERGHVRVECVGDAARAVHAGDDVLCLPTRAAGWVGRANALLDSGAAPALVLTAADAGLALTTPRDPARGELVALRIRALLAEGRAAEASAAARTYLESGATSRRDEVRDLAATLPPVRK